MSIDYGDRRIGVALSDPMHKISYPLCVIDQNRDGNSINRILEIAYEKEVEKIIIGLPLSMSGHHSNQTKKVISFKDLLIEELLLKNIKIVIDTIDERLSSKSAKDEMIKQGIKTGYNKGKIDTIAAAIILQEYLDSK